MTRAAALALARRTVLGALGAALALYVTAPHGPALSPDSTIYLSVADRLLEGGGFVQFDDQPMTRWAPLYPALVAGVARLAGHVDTAQAARVFDAVAFGIALVLLVGWLDRHVRSWIVRAIASFTIVFAPMLLQCAAFVWSETTYIALALACLRACEALFAGASGGTRRAWLVVLGLSTGFAAATRYAGIALVPVALVSLFMAPAPAHAAAPARRGRALEALGVLVLALLPLGLWLLRNAWLTGHPFGESWPARAGLSRNTAILLHVVSLWWFPPSVPLPLRLAFVGAALSAWTIALARLVRRGALAALEARAAFAPHALFLASSITVLLAWASVSGIETISDRYGAPLFPSVVLLAAWTIDRLLAERAGPGLVLALSIVGAVLTWHSAERTLKLTRLYRGPGEWGYRSKAWEGSATIAAAQVVLPPGALVYSNAPDALYARLRTRARLLPLAQGQGRAGRAERELEAARVATARVGEAWIVEFESLQRTILVSTEALAGDCAIDSVANTGDGTILRIRCAPASAPR